MRTIWSLEHTAAELKGGETGENSPSFKEDDFYPTINVDNLYEYDSEVAAFTKLLGSKNQATDYLSDRSKYYLARGKNHYYAGSGDHARIILLGHFAPRADFVFGAHTRATFHFVNVAPQWQVFNGGVWNGLEMSVRKYIISTGTDLEIYTGKETWNEIIGFEYLPFSSPLCSQDHGISFHCGIRKTSWFRFISLIQEQRSKPSRFRSFIGSSSLNLNQTEESRSSVSTIPTWPSLTRRITNCVQT